MKPVAPPPPKSLPRRTVWVLAVGAGVAVANLYYAQPLLADLATRFGVGDRAMGLAAALSQVGYALGLLLFVPLGDAVERRRLVLVMLLLVTAALLATALAPGFAWFAAAQLALGATTIAPQLLVPLAATLAAPAERGRVVGAVMSGLLIGILASRTASGFVGARLGWQAVYFLAAALTLALAVVLRLLLPRSDPPAPVGYVRLLASLGGLLRTEPVLRQSCLFGALGFGAMIGFWNTLSFFLAAPPYHYGPGAAGLFGLVGVAGAAAASGAGRMADRHGPWPALGGGLVLMLLAYLLLWAFGRDLAALVAGVVVLDLGAQAAHISNQARIFALREEVRNRLNTVYMVTFFVGGAGGSALAAYAWGRWGWSGVCAVGTGLLAVALTILVIAVAGGPGRASRI